MKKENDVRAKCYEFVCNEIFAKELWIEGGFQDDDLQEALLRHDLLRKKTTREIKQCRAQHEGCNCNEYYNHKESDEEIVCYAPVEKECAHLFIKDEEGFIVCNYCGQYARDIISHIDKEIEKLEEKYYNTRGIYLSLLQEEFEK